MYSIIDKPIVNISDFWNSHWLGKGIRNFWNKTTGSALTDAELEANAYQERMSNTANQRSVEDMQKAGLNTALMYSGGSAASTPSSVSPSSGSVDPFQLALTALSLPLELKKLKADIQHTETDTEKKAAETASERERVKLIKEQTSVAHSQINEVLSRTDLNDSQREQLVTISQYLDRQLDANLRKTEAEIKWTDSQRNRVDKLLQGELDIQIQTIADLAKHIDYMDKLIDKVSAETGLLREDIANYALNHSSNGWLGTGLSIQNIIRLLKEF